MIYRIDKVKLDKVITDDIEDGLEGMVNFEIKTENSDDGKKHPLTLGFYLGGNTHNTVETLEKVFGEILTQLQYQDINKLQLTIDIRRFDI